MARVSVLMPTFNRGPTIGGAIESLLGQTYKDWELIIYDDGSDALDGTMDLKGKITTIGPKTEKVLLKYKDQRIKYHKEKTNVGVAAARNRLMAMSSSELCCWLDSDDRANKWRLELQVQAHDRYSPGYVRTSTTTFAKQADAGWALPPILVWRGGVSFATILFSRLGAPLFDEKLTCGGEDMEWECHMAAIRGKSVQIPLTLYCIGRRTPDRLSMRYKSVAYQKEATACRDIVDRKREKWTNIMKDKGYTKLPKNVEWDMLEPHMRLWYSSRYK